MRRLAKESQRPRRAGGARAGAARAALLLSGLACSAACSRKPSVRPDVTPPLASDLVEAAAQQAALQDPEAGPPLTPGEQVAHVLSRTTFGARPSDRERVARQGVAAFLEEQLHPERLDDAEAEQKLQGLRVLGRSSGELSRELAAYRKEQKDDREREERERREAALAESRRLRAAGEKLVAGALPAQGPVTADESAQHARLVDDASEVAAAGAKDPKSLRRVMGKAARGPGFDYVLELAEAKLIRAVSSQRQLEEVMADFWFNHFNVFAGKSEEAALLPEYEREAIRRNALASFPELLGATAHSPAMLIYLDNWMSTAPAGAETGARRFYRRRDGEQVSVRAGAKGRKAAGLNENYARELLELHTLGVDGGYTQKDVTEVARCFTGWTVAEPLKDPRFIYRPELHDDGPKVVLGLRIDAGGGERDGERVLELLARHPSTARFVAQKLVRRFVSDDPPQALVERVAATYAQTSGDVRSMLRTIFEAPEFWSRRALKAKMRSPLELVSASVRSLGAQVDEPWQLARAVARIGEPLYAAQPPTGYPDTAQGWASSGALLARIDFGLQLAMGQLDGVQVDLAMLAWGAKGPEEVLDRAAARLGAGELQGSTREYILGALRELRVDRKPELAAQRAVGLLLGAPELQRR